LKELDRQRIPGARGIASLVGREEKLDMSRVRGDQDLFFPWGSGKWEGRNSLLVGKIQVEAPGGGGRLREGSFNAPDTAAAEGIRWSRMAPGGMIPGEDRTAYRG